MARSSTGSDRGDAGLPLLLITPALLFIVLHLVNASQQLYERREAFSVASAAVRLGNQADQVEVRRQQSAAVDVAKSTRSIRNFLADEEYDVVSLRFHDDRGDGTVTVSIEIRRRIDYVFPNLGVLSDTVDGRASAVLNRGVSAPGS